MNTIFKPDPLTRVNDKLLLKNGNTMPLTDSVKSPLIPGGPNDSSNRFQSDFFQFFGLDIVTETLFNHPYPYITEKTMRPITSKRPFIVLGGAGILTLLQRKGFKTFNSIIDESYDAISDYSDRFDAVCDSINKFVSQPIEKIKQDVESVIDILEHNFRHYLILEDLELSQLKL
jgi:hypothetical protein